MSFLKQLAEVSTEVVRGKDAIVHDEEEEKFPKVRTIEDVMEVWGETLRDPRCPARLLHGADLDRVRGNGWEEPEGGWPGFDVRKHPGHCYPFRVERRELVPVDAILSMKGKAQLSEDICQSLSSRKDGTFHHALTHVDQTSQGKWAIAEYHVTTERRSYLDGTRPARMRLDDAKWHKTEDFSLLEMANVKKESFLVLILWVDTSGAVQPYLDHNGKPLPVVNVTNAPAPALDLTGLGAAIGASLREGLAARETPAPAPVAKEEPTPPVRRGPGRPPGLPPKQGE